MTQKMFKTLFTILIVFVLVLASFFVVYNYVPLRVFDLISINKSLGTTITTILGTDTLSASRTTINNNFTALNSGKIENSSTSIAAITTLSNLTSVGTIATGVWSGTAISVSKGGTGTTSPTLHMVILGNGSSGFKVVDGFGTTGQFLTSNGAGTAPTWQTSAVALGDDYAWTGDHSWSQLATFASSTFSATSTFNGRITSGTASTTVYNDLKVMGSLSVGNIIYGRKYPCMGRITVPYTSSPVIYASIAVACDFKPSFIIFHGTLSGDAGVKPKANIFSDGFSDGSTNYATGFYNADGTVDGFYSSTSSVDVLMASSGNIQSLQGSSTITTTGFNFTYNAKNYHADQREIIDYVAY